MIKGVLGGIIPFLERTLDVRAARHEVISSNIANEETPGYRARDVDFEKELKSSMNRSSLRPVVTHAGHISGSLPLSSDVRIVVSDDRKAGLDGNTVSLEKEMVKVTENTMMYRTAVSMLSKKFQIIRDAIKEGR